MTRQTWYIFEDGKTHGPVTARELLYLVEMDRLDPDALVWRPGFSEWKPAHEVEGIYKPPPLPMGPDSKTARSTRVSHPTEFVRVIAPPIKSTDDGDGDGGTSGRSRGPARARSGNNGRAGAETVDIDPASASESPIPDPSKFSAQIPAGHANDDLEDEDAPPRKAAGFGPARPAKHVDDSTTEESASIPDAAKLGAFRPARQHDDDMEDDEAPPPRRNGLAENATPPSPPGRRGAQAGPRPSLAIASAEARAPDASAADGEAAGERLEVLDKLVGRMEALEGNLRDEIAKNQDLQKQIRRLKEPGAEGGPDDQFDDENGDLDDYDLAPEPIGRAPRRTSAEGRSKPPPDAPEPRPRGEESDVDDTRATKGKSPRGPKKSKPPAEDLDADYELAVEFEESFDDDVAVSDVASADWLNVVAESDSSGKSYVSRHWSGELGLAKSVWANAIPMLIVLLALPVGLSFVEFGAGPIEIVAAAVLFVVSLPLMTWMGIGVWRAAEHHRAWRGGFVWPSLAQTWVLVSIVAFLGTFAAVLLPDRIAELFSMRLDLKSLDGDGGVAQDDAKNKSARRLAPGRTLDTSIGQVEDRLASQDGGRDRQFDPQPAEDGQRNASPTDTNSLKARISGLREKSKGSLVQVISFNANKIPTNVGMGFYVRNDLVVTTFHTVQGAHALSLQNVGGKDISFSARLKSYSTDLDIALIETTRKADPLKFAATSELRIGDSVFVLGNPRWEASAATIGSIRAAQPFGDSVAYLSTALVSPGSSGGPVFDGNGNLKGMARFSVKNSTPMTFVMPADVIDAVARRDMSKVKESPGSEVNDSIRATLKLTNYAKAPGSETEVISLKNATKHSLENIFFAVLYKGKGGDILYGRSLQMKGPLLPGAEETMTVRVPDLLKNYASMDAKKAGSSPTMSVELIPLDYLPTDYSG